MRARPEPARAGGANRPSRVPAPQRFGRTVAVVLALVTGFSAMAPAAFATDVVGPQAAVTSAPTVVAQGSTTHNQTSQHQTSPDQPAHDLPTQDPTSASSATDAAAGALDAPEITPEPPSTPLLVVAPRSPLVGPGEGLIVDATITNPADAEVIPAGTVTLELGPSIIATRPELTEWIETGYDQWTGQVAQVPHAEVLPGTQTTVTFTVDPSVLAEWGIGYWGPHPIRAELDELDIEARSTAVWNVLTEGFPITLTLMSTLDSPVSRTGLLDAATLAYLTQPAGPLTAQLAALTMAQPVAGVQIAVDPMVIVSIRVLGDAAPASAIAWLETLESHASQVSLLPYGQQQQSALAAAGVGPLEPLGIPTADGMLATDVATALEGHAPSFTVQTVGAPVPEELALADVAVVSSTSVQEPVQRWSTPDASVTVGSQSVLSADAELLTLVDRATTSPDPAVRADAIAQVAALLCAILRDGAGVPRAVVSVIPEGADPEAVQALLTALSGAAWLQPAALSDVIAAPTRGVDLAYGELTEAEVVAGTRLTELLDAEAQVAAFATTITRPEHLIAEYRLQLLAAVSGRWTTAESTIVGMSFIDRAEAVASSVTVIQGSHVNSVSDQFAIPIPIANTFDQDVTVTLVVQSNTPGLVLEQQRVDVVVPPGGLTTTIDARALTNGESSFSAWLEASDGVRLGDPVEIGVRVEAFVGLAVQWAFGGGVMLLFVLGIWRSIRKRSRGDARGDLDTAIEDETLFAGAATGPQPTPPSDTHEDSSDGRGR